MLFGDTAVGIAFNRPVWDSVLFHPEGWTLSGNHRAAWIHRASPHQWVLRLAQPVGSEPLEIRPPHPYDQVTLQVGLPQPPQPGQALLNEVLFEPRSTGAEFVELYRTDGFTDLSQLHLVELDADVKTLLKTFRITEEPYLLPPGTHVALTPDTLAVRKGHASGLLFETLAWPGLSNDGGAMGVATTGLILLEGLAFDPDMHFELLENTAGFSLERLSSSLVASDKATWHSGAQLVGGATPGLMNSQQVAAIHSNPAFTVSPHPITPNGDGMNDVLTVAYRFSQPGYAITIHIFDLSGQLIQTVANNALAETEGLAVWNATEDSGGLARTGPYVVWMQAIHPGGDQILQRASAAVSH
jgi:hypothetical protein